MWITRAVLTDLANFLLQSLSSCTTWSLPVPHKSGSQATLEIFTKHWHLLLERSTYVSYSCFELVIKKFFKAPPSVRVRGICGPRITSGRPLCFIHGPKVTSKIHEIMAWYSWIPNGHSQVGRDLSRRTWQSIVRQNEWCRPIEVPRCEDNVWAPRSPLVAWSIVCTSCGDRSYVSVNTAIRKYCSSLTAVWIHCTAEFESDNYETARPLFMAP